MPANVLRAILDFLASPTTGEHALARGTRRLAVDLRGWLEGRVRYICPLCGYEGYFDWVRSSTGDRPDGRCPGCGSRERHRAQALAMRRLMAGVPVDSMRILHCAPEPFFADWFRSEFGRYVSCDLTLPGVDVRTDLCACPFADDSFDIVFASHVLEHIHDDRKVLRELNRILAEPGFAVLPVPIKGDATKEYPEPDPSEHGHVRSPGTDYFDRLREAFDDVQVLTSDDFPARHQPYVYEQRSMVGRPSRGEDETSRYTRHRDYVPICFLGDGHRIS